MILIVTFKKSISLSLLLYDIAKDLNFTVIRKVLYFPGIVKIEEIDPCYPASKNFGHYLGLRILINIYLYLKYLIFDNKIDIINSQ